MAVSSDFDVFSVFNSNDNGTNDSDDEMDKIIGSSYHLEQTNVWFGQLPDVDLKFRALRQHLDNNISTTIKSNEAELEMKIDKIRELQNNIFKLQFKRFIIHEHKDETNNDIKNNNDNNTGRRQAFANEIFAEIKSERIKKNSNNMESKENVTQNNSTNNMNNADDIRNKTHYQDILDSFNMDENETNDLLQKLKKTTDKMYVIEYLFFVMFLTFLSIYVYIFFRKELNEIALGRQRK